MPKFKPVTDQNENVRFLETNALGSTLLTTAKLNKGTAFTESERQELGLLGKLPYRVESLQQQTQRVYQQFLKKEDNLEKHLYLRCLHNTNEILFYKLVSQHLTEMLPVLYTPTVGKAVEQFSQEFQEARGLYIAYPDNDRIDQILDNRLNPEVDIIVMTDGEGVLGLGDQGIGGMGICIAKLIVYVLCAGINPNRLLPIQIDVGTNNEQLLNDPLYLGWRHPRVSGQQYDDMIARVVSAIQRKLPRAYLHWEDFGRENARRNLECYRDTMCTFNDDMQGTGAVTLVALLSAIRRTKVPLTEQRIVIVGAGTAGTGIADQLCAGMLRQGLSRDEALSRFYLVGRHGLIQDSTPNLTAFQKPYAQRLMNKTEATWQLYDVVQKFKPTVLIGSSGQGGIFTEAIVKTMASQVEYPIIFPLSNPTEKSEATPDDLFNWTEGRALIATGSPFGQVYYKGEKIPIAQCNNALIYPGIGLGVVTAQATRLSDGMIWEACNALSHFTQTSSSKKALLPHFEDIQAMSRCIALAVAAQARREGLAQVPDSIDLTQEMDRQFWKPEYLPYRYSKSL
ncbi:NAD-dependent malic enzyme [Rickettsiella grylli]|uniref:Malolactic enzyme n=1 Tax=Rickettsiella grylli TaxID=59196 RepID=A8PLI3_9COXI|nr:NAD-dependent malic enzyme [Rickettsiella grylli]EDP46302.1 NAD-dependent malic enzyme (NAD-ME) [Rickettsiella grylli]